MCRPVDPVTTVGRRLTTTKTSRMCSYRSGAFECDALPTFVYALGASGLMCATGG